MAAFKPPKDNIKHREQILAMAPAEQEAFIRDLITSMEVKDREHLVTLIQLDYQRLWDNSHNDVAHAAEAAAWVNDSRSLEQESWATSFRHTLTPAALAVVRTTLNT